MDDEEILACVAEALGIQPDGGRVFPLEGRQGLLVSRVTLPGAPSCIFKAVRESCRKELHLASWLSRITPYAVPAVIHIEDDRKRGFYWLMMEDEGDERLCDRPSIQDYARAAGLLARMQVDMLTSLDELNAMGVRTIDTQGWEEIALALLTALDEGRLRFVVEHRGFMEGLWRVGEMASDAAAVPYSLIHGDLHAGNITVSSGGEVRLLDWGSAYVGAAFLGLSELLWPAQRFARRLGDFGPIRKAYLDPWVPLLGKPGRLTHAIAACDALARLSVVQEALRCPERFGDFGAASSANHFVEAGRQWERARTC